jgi:hypothetical protein
MMFKTYKLNRIEILNENKPSSSLCLTASNSLCILSVQLSHVWMLDLVLTAVLLFFCPGIKGRAMLLWMALHWNPTLVVWKHDEMMSIILL